jgi:methyl-accepting chemotaxis protein
MNALVSAFETTVASVVRSVSSSAIELEASAEALSATAGATRDLSGKVLSASAQASENVQSVAAASEELISSVGEISRQVQESTRIALEAVAQAEKTDARIAELTRAASRIGDVVKLITAIAEQTNLLALNATIEAARAGEAGKGFAVVANEVKELAKQTAKATEDISRKITAIQTDTHGAIEAIATISGVINHINDISGTIATAVEEQSATTNEMTRNLGDAARGSTEITSSISGIAKAAESTSLGASDTQKAVLELVQMSALLSGLVEQFKIDAGDLRRRGREVTPPALGMAAHAGR